MLKNVNLRYFIFILCYFILLSSFFFVFTGNGKVSVYSFVASVVSIISFPLKP